MVNIFNIKNISIFLRFIYFGSFQAWKFQNIPATQQTNHIWRVFHLWLAFHQNRNHFHELNALLLLQRDQSLVEESMFEPNVIQ